MIELRDDTLRFSYPEVHREAVLEIDFQRTLRIPDDGDNHWLPPGLGSFPLRHVDDFDDVPSAWQRHGGVMLPMYQSEAMWLSFHSPHGYPFALRIAAGKVDAVSGSEWKERLRKRDQNYVVVPDQPWLDGFCVEKGIIRQFVAMPLGAGYTAEEQITGKAEHGGLQLLAIPLKADAWKRMQESRWSYMPSSMEANVCASSPAMGLAPGGRMRQEIYEDPYQWRDWDRKMSSRCFVHLVNSLVWRGVTGEQPPTTPPTSKEYTRAGLPWFDYYDDRQTTLDGTAALAALESIAEMGKNKGDIPLPENEGIKVDRVSRVGPARRPDQVREGAF
jgi:hypothetical protein